MAKEVLKLNTLEETKKYLEDQIKDWKESQEEQDHEDFDDTCDWMFNNGYIECLEDTLAKIEGKRKEWNYEKQEWEYL